MPVWVQPVTALLWSFTTVVAAAASVLLPSARRSGWVAAWPPLAALSMWWAGLNVARLTGDLTLAAYRTAIAPVVPALFVSLSVLAIVYVARAVRTDRLEQTLSGAIGDVCKRSTDDEQ